jgi:hypothetical protein
MSSKKRHKLVSEHKEDMHKQLKELKENSTSRWMKLRRPYRILMKKSIKI